MNADRWDVVVTGRTNAGLELGRIAPDSWTVHVETDALDLADTHHDSDAVVVVWATGSSVGTARDRHPYSEILAVVDRAVDASEVVAVFDAGADACVRGMVPSELLAHLFAMRRRQLLERSSAALAG